MEIKEIIGYAIGAIAVLGGLSVAAIAVWIGTKAAMQEKITLLETRTKERLALIEKGMDPTLFDKKTDKGNSYGALLWGFLLTGVGLGSLIGFFIANANGFDERSITSTFALLFGGIGLLLYYFYKRKSEGKKA
jgi:hypothetical protein